MAVSTEELPPASGTAGAASAAPRSRRRQSARRPNYLAGLLALVWLVLIGYPIVSMLSWSIQQRESFQDRGPLAPPATFTLDNYHRVLFELDFNRYFLNTVFVTVAVIALVLLVGLPAAYAIVRSNSWVVGASFRMFLAGLAIPAQAVIIPLYLIIRELDLYDSLWAIIFPTAAFSLPLAILVLAGSLRDVTKEMYEAMAVDGGGPFRMLWNLVLPLSRGSVMAVSIYAGLNAWNGFIFPFLFTQDPDKRMLTLGLSAFRNQFGAVDIPGLMAAVFLSALPLVVLYVFARRWLIAGLAGVGGK